VRKIISLSLIAILLINLFGYFISFTVQRARIRTEVKQLMKAEKMKHTQQFVFTEHEYEQLSKEDNGKEFKLNGGLYDVVKKEAVDGKIILTAYYDHKETGLLDKFTSYFTDETQPDKGKQTVPVFSLLEFIFHNADWKCYDSFVCFRLTSYSSNLLSLTLDSASPPPDLVFA
jgi:hypothetical protein